MRNQKNLLKSIVIAGLLLPAMMTLSLAQETESNIEVQHPKENIVPLQKAVEADDLALVKEILATLDMNEVDIDLRDYQARTPLMLAVQMNNPEIAALLIAAGASVNAKDNVLDTPYLLAGAEGYNEILQMTLENGADIYDTNRFGGTALIPAAEKGHLETVKILINAGVDPNHVNNLGWTALMEAVLLGDGSQVYQEIVQTLIEAGANPNIPDKKGRTPLDYSKEKDFDEMTKLLKQHGGK